MSDEQQIPATGLVWRLSNKWRSAVDRELVGLGLTHAQYAVLAPLLGMTTNGLRPSQRELADRIGLEPLYVSKIVRGLETAGWVARTPDARDARAVRLTLTRSGRQLTAKAIALVVALQDQLLEPLGGAGSTLTLALLDAVHTLLASPDPKGLT